MPRYEIVATKGTTVVYTRRVPSRSNAVYLHLCIARDLLGTRKADEVLLWDHLEGEFI